jgi:hypothetical protein
MVSEYVRERQPGWSWSSFSSLVQGAHAVFTRVPFTSIQRVERGRVSGYSAYGSWKLYARRSFSGLR